MSPAALKPGILAIFNDCRLGREAEFEAWFQGEHLIERLAVPGFLFGRRHKAIAGAPGYFNFYMVETPEVLTSKPYLERLDNPTPDETVLSGLLEKLTADTAVAGGEIWIALDPAGMPVSMEEKLRGGDKKISGALLIDTLYQEHAEAIGVQLAKQFPGTDICVYRVLCQIGRGDL
jgi:hypothetical protein